MRILALLLVLLLPGLAGAQTDERGYLTALLEDNLSGAGRERLCTGVSQGVGEPTIVDASPRAAARELGLL